MEGSSRCSSPLVPSESKWSRLECLGTRLGTGPKAHTPIRVSVRCAEMSRGTDPEVTDAVRADRYPLRLGRQSVQCRVYVVRQPCMSPSPSPAGGRTSVRSASEGSEYCWTNRIVSGSTGRTIGTPGRWRPDNLDSDGSFTFGPSLSHYRRWHRDRLFMVAFRNTTG